MRSGSTSPRSRRRRRSGPSTCARSRTRSGTSCPGPRSSRRSCAPTRTTSGSTPRLLVEEYRQRYERPATKELTPFAPPPAAPRAPPPAPLLGARDRVVLGMLALLGALYLLGTLGRRRLRRRARRRHATADRDADAEDGARKRKRRSAGPDASCGSRSCRPGPSASAWWTPRAAADRQRDARGGQRHRDVPRQALPRVVRQRPGAHARRRQGLSTSPTTTPVGYEVRAGGKPRALPESSGRPAARMSVRAGIVVTGTEVLSGIIADRNGPWLSERLRERGVDSAAHRGRRRPPGRPARGAATSSPRGRGPDRHQRRARADRGRPHRRGGGGVRRARDGRSTRRSRSGSGRSSSGCGSALAQPRRGGDARGQPQAGAGARGRDGARAGRHRAGAGRAAGSPTTCRRAARAAARAAADVGGGARDRAAARACSLGGRDARAADHAPVRHPGVGDRALAARDRGRRGAARRGWRSRPACGAARSRSRRCSPRAAAAASTTRSRRACASATATRCSPTTARRSTSRWSRCCSPAARSRSPSRAPAG